MGAAAEAQPNSIVGKPFTLEALAYAGLLQQVDSSLLEESGAHALFDILAAARFDHGRLDALQVEKMRKQETGRPGAYDSDLCAQFHGSGRFARAAYFTFILQSG